jgi:hypothetical protein
MYKRWLREALDKSAKRQGKTRAGDGGDQSPREQQQQLWGNAAVLLQGAHMVLRDHDGCAGQPGGKACDTKSEWLGVP